MRAWIADYQIVAPLGGDEVDPSGARPSRSPRFEGSAPGAGATPAKPTERTYLAQPPARLGLDDAPVVVHTLATSSAHERQSRQHQLSELARARSAHLPALLELGSDGDADGSTEGGSTEGDSTTEDSATDHRATDHGATDHGATDHGAIFWSHTWTGEATMAAPPFALSLAFVLWLVAGAARGAHALHEAGVAHGNITLESIRFNDRVASLDLPGPPGPAEGLVRQLSQLAELDLVDPAVVRGEIPSRASDIWTLGAILHFGLTGQLLHPRLGEDQPVTAVQRVIFEQPTILDGIDPEAHRIVAACLARDPARRPPTAAELAERLETLGRQR